LWQHEENDKEKDSCKEEKVVLSLRLFIFFLTLFFEKKRYSSAGSAKMHAWA